MKLTKQDIKENCTEWRQKGFILPEYDMDEMVKKTEKAPEWIHFGAGNIFRAYIARIADDLLKAGEMETGIIAVNNSDSESIERIYKPCDCLTLLVGLRAKGNRYYRVLGSVAKALAAKGNGLEELLKMAEKESLKIISYTITEKGYAVKDVSGKILPQIEQDIKEGPDGNLDTVIGKTAAMLNKRYKANGRPISLVSMDNCSHNGEKLKEGVSLVIEKWAEAGLVEEGLKEYLAEKVAFPCSMIDKITPRPAETVAKELKELGVEDMELIVTKKGTYTSAYVNAEMPQYLVIEDCFPNGRAALEKAGVYITDLETVEKAEKMKVTVCLNPLHTALAVFGCLLGYNKISDEMEDEDLKKLVYELAYKEGIPVVPDPKIINPEDFLNEVLTERLPNSNLPDTPQRIATDTSQKLAVRYGETIKAWAQKEGTDKLELIPLVIAGWLRYLTAIDDEGNKMELSPDPELENVCKIITPEMVGKAELTAEEKKEIEKLLRNKDLFGVDLCEVGLSEKIMQDFTQMLKERGAVRETISRKVNR